MTKRLLGRQVLGSLRELPADQKAKMDCALNQRFLASPTYQAAKTLAIYLPLPHELDNRLLLTQAAQDGKQVLVPKILGPGQMVFCPYEPDHLVSSAFGILEPLSDQVVPASAIDLIHVPGLVFDPRGYRIGYGGGYYDRYLATYEGPTLATLYPCQFQAFDPEPHDLPVKELLIDDTLF